ncbi:MAG: TolC family protein [Gammaproteobacteria bacterium]|nr:TolC family protein [Gammaproteobacteria bacterium]
MKMLIKGLLAGTFSMWMAVAAQAEKLSLQQVLQQVMDHYPSLKVAAIQLERARQESIKVESQLGWQLGSQAAFTRDISLFGIPSDKLSLSGNLNKQLTSGDSISVTAAISQDDAESSFISTLPNPATNTSLDLNYRMPLAKGSDNPAYAQGLEQAAAGIVLAEAQKQTQYDQMASQLIELYLAAAGTRARLENVQQAIQRTRRLQAYIKDRFSLGVAEEQDLLQVEAQLRSSEAEYRSLEMAWQQQLISMNRLMGRAWDKDFEPMITNQALDADNQLQQMLEQVKQHSPGLKASQGRLQQADSAIASSRDARKDQMDLVMFIGQKSLSGDVVAGDYDESEMVGGVRFEFGHGIDKSGFDAALYQAQLDRSAALQEQKQVLEDIHYDLSSLLAEIRTGETALVAFGKSVRSEQAKLNEAHERYRTGRTDTDQLIQFEAQLAGAELALELQRIELARRYNKLGLLRGVLWKDIQLPEYQSLKGEQQ